MKKWMEYLASAALICSIVAVFSLTVWQMFCTDNWVLPPDERERPHQTVLSVQHSAAESAPAGGEKAPQPSAPAMGEALAAPGGEGQKAETHTQPAAPEETTDAQKGAADAPEETADLPEEEQSAGMALLIGDSRGVGLAEYGDLEDTDFFADVGMSVYSVWKKEIAVGERGKTTLEDLLSAQSYDTIYLMLGINELGYDQDQTIRTYADTVERIAGLQPEARICLMANLHVSQRRAAGDRVYNNENLDALNGRIAQLAQERELTYLDVNPVFDDESGALDGQYTSDGVHLLARYGDTWCQWLRENG